MDPNTALQECRDALDNLEADRTDPDAIAALIEHFEALDDWLKSGGFVPLAWMPAVESTSRKILDELEAAGGDSPGDQG